MPPRLTICGLAVTFTFELLISKFCQFILVPNCSKWNSRKWFTRYQLNKRVVYDYTRTHTWTARQQNASSTIHIIQQAHASKWVHWPTISALLTLGPHLHFTYKPVYTSSASSIAIFTYSVHTVFFLHEHHGASHCKVLGFLLTKILCFDVGKCLPVGWATTWHHNTTLSINTTFHLSQQICA